MPVLATDSAACDALRDYAAWMMGWQHVKMQFDRTGALRARYNVLVARLASAAHGEGEAARRAQLACAALMSAEPARGRQRRAR
jgi:hypothetical protein